MYTARELESRSPPPCHGLCHSIPRCVPINYFPLTLLHSDLAVHRFALTSKHARSDHPLSSGLSTFYYIARPPRPARRLFCHQTSFNTHSQSTALRLLTTLLSRYHFISDETANHLRRPDIGVRSNSPFSQSIIHLLL
jgi:hypothetical protein